MILSALQYHQQTCYSRENMNGHHLNWKTQPTLYKQYDESKSVPLPLPRILDIGRLSSILKGERKRSKPNQLKIVDLSTILHVTYGITATAQFSWGEFHYRSAASAGALYPTEIYMATHAIDGLEDGLYYFSGDGLKLIQLRQNIEASAGKMLTRSAERTSSLAFFLTAIYFRSSWKYRNRSYRYHLLDTGHVLENLSIALRVFGCTHGPFYDFDDSAVNRFLGLDETKEVTLAGMTFPHDSVISITGREIDELSQSARNASVVSDGEIDYPMIRETHAVTASANQKNMHSLDMAEALGIFPRSWQKLPSLSTWPETIDYHSAVVNRRSSRNFMHRPITEDCLVALIESLVDLRSDSITRHYLAIGIVLGNVEKWESGFYLYDSQEHALGSIISSDLMTPISSICLDQKWLALAGVHVLFLTNISILEKQWGSRAYRTAMMTAGRLGERLYITATAFGMGCCGIGAFYDKEIPPCVGITTDASLLYLVAVGQVMSLISR